MNLEGGVGGDFLRGRVTLGVVYYASLKLTADRIDGLPLNIDPGKTKSSLLDLRSRRRSNGTVSCTGS
jgi:hypothetical protein